MTKRTGAALVLSCLFVLLAHAGGNRLGSSPTQPDSAWLCYRNVKYHYQISYPRGYLILETGLDSLKDGRTLLVVRKNQSSLLNTLDIQVYPPVYRESVQPFDPRQISVDTMTVNLNGVASLQVQVRERKGGSLVKVVIYRDSTSFIYDPPADVKHFHETIWWQIVQTFVSGAANMKGCLTVKDLWEVPIVVTDSLRTSVVDCDRYPLGDGVVAYHQEGRSPNWIIDYQWIRVQEDTMGDLFLVAQLDSLTAAGVASEHTAIQWVTYRVGMQATSYDEMKGRAFAGRPMNPPAAVFAAVRRFDAYMEGE